MSYHCFAAPLRPALRISAGLAVAAAATLSLAGPSAADHTHSKQTGNGACVLLAKKSNEGNVELPYATDAQVAANRAHPIHLNVHLGKPGSDGSIGVYGSAGDPCAETGRYLNLSGNLNIQ